AVAEVHAKEVRVSVGLERGEVVVDAAR
ncbi:MAG: hypothetical protein QOD90_1125, partial [Mycobacterium sp.]|nr:hypothetical protein [Mycobacterium sp.]